MAARSVRRPRIGVIGTGWFGRCYHLPALRGYDRCTVTAVCDRDLDAARTAADEFEVPHAFGDISALIEADVVDAVVIATWHTTHFPLAKAALDAGKAVLVEKPMTIDAGEAWELVRLAELRQVPLLVGYTHQFTSVAARVRDAVQGGTIGELLQVVGSYPSSVRDLLSGKPPPEIADRDRWHPTYADPALAGGGQGQTQLTHLAGMALWVTAERATQAFAFMNNAGLQVDLADAVAFRLGSGAVGTFASTGSAAGDGAAQTLQYYGTNGHVVQDLSRAHATVVAYDGVTAELSLQPQESAYPTHQPARTLVDLVTDRTTVNPAPGRPAAHTVELLAAAYAAARSGTSQTITARAEARP